MTIYRHVDFKLYCPLQFLNYYTWEKTLWLQIREESGVQITMENVSGTKFGIKIVNFIQFCAHSTTQLQYIQRSSSQFSVNTPLIITLIITRVYHKSNTVEILILMITYSSSLEYEYTILL